MAKELFLIRPVDMSEPLVRALREKDKQSKELFLIWPVDMSEPFVRALREKVELEIFEYRFIQIQTPNQVPSTPQN